MKYCRARFDVRRTKEIFLFTTASKTGSGSHLVSICWESGTLSPGLKGPGREDDHSPLFSTEAMVKCTITLLPHVPS
jgi:hypothetical protein